MKKLFMLCIAFLVSITVSAQDIKSIKPEMKGLASKTSNAPVGAPTAQFEKAKNFKVEKPATPSSAFEKQKSKNNSVSFIYPPYQKSDSESWSEGTGYVRTADAQKDGYTYHSSSSYDWGSATSRCWNIVYFKPIYSGYYRVTVESYQEGRFELNVGRNGQQAYAYRLIGVNVEGLGYYSNMLSEYYLASKGNQKPSCRGTGYVEKEYYFQAGKTYTLTGYTEVGGWSNGDNTTWYTANVSCTVEPFKVEFLHN